MTNEATTQSHRQGDHKSHHILIQHKFGTGWHGSEAVRGQGLVKALQLIQINTFSLF